jgi:cation-transporting ATPase E
MGERLRPQIRETVAFFRDEGVELKVLSGDNPETAAAIARDVGIDVGGVVDGRTLPEDSADLQALALNATVIGRISPEGKRAVVEALRDDGRYVAMVGDGVNDVPALKASRLAIAQGTGTQIAKGVADLVLIDGDFAAVPELVHQGRQALRNLQRVARLYLAKSSFAAFLILTIGTTSTAYPLLPRHLTIAAAVTIGIPTFFLALAPSAGAWHPAGFARRAAGFAVPAGMIVGVGVVASYLFALHNLGYTVGEARVIATTVLVLAGLYLVYGIEGGSLRRRTAVGPCASYCSGFTSWPSCCRRRATSSSSSSPTPAWSSLPWLAPCWPSSPYSWRGSRRLTASTRPSAGQHHQNGGFSSPAPRLMLGLSALALIPRSDGSDHSPGSATGRR